MVSGSLHSSSKLWNLHFWIKDKLYFHLKTGLWPTEQRSSSSLQVRCLYLGLSLVNPVWRSELSLLWIQHQFTPSSLWNTWNVREVFRRSSPGCSFPCWTFSTCRGVENRMETNPVWVWNLRHVGQKCQTRDTKLSAARNNNKLQKIKGYYYRYMNWKTWFQDETVVSYIYSQETCI